MSEHHLSSADIRKKIGHPVIDGDGHLVEYMPAYVEYLKQVAGPSMVERFQKSMSRNIGPYWFNLDTAARREKGVPRGPWWGRATKNTLDGATAMLPNLLRQRLDGFGIDFGVIYPTLGLMIVREEDEELRRATCRALNVMLSDVFREHSDRMTPAATIPMYSPKEAIEEAEYANRTLGMKAFMIGGFVRRPVPAAQKLSPEAAQHTFWVDNIALDSEFDYDPFWKKCIELKVAPTAHSAGMGWGSRVSPSNYVFNHIGMFAAAHESFAKALVIGGVTRRFPNLNIGFLEGGVGWAVNLLSDMIGHWEKRNARGIQNYNPAHMDVDGLVKLFMEHGGKVVAHQSEAQVRETLARMKANAQAVGNVMNPDELDDFIRAGADTEDKLLERFVPRFWFGCEADDPMVASAFNTKLVPGGRKLNAIFSSDISHWDVVDMQGVLQEAWELVEHEMIDEADFRAFTCENIARLHGGMNPDFFKGTVVEQDVARILGTRKAA